MNNRGKFKLSKKNIAGLTAILFTTFTLLPTSCQTINASVGSINIASSQLISKTSTTSTYTVASGDTLEKIASKYNTTVNDLKLANNLSTDLIHVGQSLVVPTSTVATQTATNTPAPAIKPQSNIDLSKYGKFNIAGMTNENYNDAMTKKWVEVIPEGAPVDMNIDINKAYTYVEMENIMLNLAKYEGVSLYKIGQTSKGRNLYSLNIDFGSDLNLIDGEITASENIKNKEVLLCTGQIHGCEFAGSVYILKQFNDLIKKAQTDIYTKALLQNVIYVSIPCVNPDGREISKETQSTTKKSNANGVDLNRNFPAMNAGQLNVGVKKNTTIKSAPCNGHFPGYTLGSELETQAAMKWLNFFVPISNSLIDYHQQGGGTYSKKGWDAQTNQTRYVTYANIIHAYLNNGAKGSLYSIFKEPYNGLDGIGGTITDYAASVAMGQQWSSKYGRMVLKDTEGNDIPLMVYKYLDNPNYIKYYVPANTEFVTSTLEIVKNKASLGYGATARNLIAKEYANYNFAGLLTYRAEIALGKGRLDTIKKQIENGEITYNSVDKVVKVLAPSR